MKERACKDCVFFDSNYPPAAAGEGLCRRNAPLPHTQRDAEEQMAYWPLVKPSDWCGQFEKAKRTSGGTEVKPY